MQQIQKHRKVQKWIRTRPRLLLSSRFYGNSSDSRQKKNVVSSETKKTGKKFLAHTRNSLTFKTKMVFIPFIVGIQRRCDPTESHEDNWRCGFFWRFVTDFFKSKTISTELTYFSHEFWKLFSANQLPAVKVTKIVRKFTKKRVRNGFWPKFKRSKTRSFDYQHKNNGGFHWRAHQNSNMNCQISISFECRFIVFISIIFAVVSKWKLSVELNNIATNFVHCKRCHRHKSNDNNSLPKTFQNWSNRWQVSMWVANFALKN